MLRNLGVGAGNFAAGVALIVVPYLWLMVIQIAKGKILLIFPRRVEIFIH